MANGLDRPLGNYPIVILQAISPEAFLHMRNLVMLSGFSIREWAYDKNDRWGGIQIDGFKCKSGEVPIADALHLDGFQAKLTALLESAAHAAGVALFANSSRSFQVSGDDEYHASPEECVEKCLQEPSKVSPICRICL